MRYIVSGTCLAVCGCKGTMAAISCVQDRYACSSCVPNAHETGRVDTWAECERHAPEWVRRARANALPVKVYRP